MNAQLFFSRLYLPLPHVMRLFFWSIFWMDFTLLCDRISFAISFSGIVANSVMEALKIKSKWAWMLLGSFYLISYGLDCAVTFIFCIKAGRSIMSNSFVKSILVPVGSLFSLGHGVLCFLHALDDDVDGWSTILLVLGAFYTGIKATILFFNKQELDKVAQDDKPLKEAKVHPCKMHSRMCDYDPYNPLSLDENQGLERYLQFESSIRTAEDYDNNKINDKLRYRALVIITTFSESHNFDPVVPYLALNYFDRYFARGNDVPTVTRTVVEHDVELLAICCLALASRMRNGHFTLSNFQAENQGIRRVTMTNVMEMELYVLKGLNWDLRVVTALSFLPCFALKLRSTYAFNCRTISEIVIISQQSNFVKKQKPSVVAASAFLAASKYLYPEHYPTFFDQMMLEGIIKETNEKKCIEYMIKLCGELKLTAESFRAKRLVGARLEYEQGAAETSEQASAEKSAQSTGDESKQHPAKQSKQRADETCEEPKQVATEAGETSSGHTPAETFEKVATETSERSNAGQTKQVPNQGAADKGKKQVEESKQHPAEKSKQRADETCEDPKQAAAEACETSSGHTPAETFEKLATETSEQSNAGQTKQVPNQGAADKGKKQVEETKSEAKMAEECEDMEFKCPLRWKFVFQLLPGIESVQEESEEEEEEDPESDQEAIQRAPDLMAFAQQRSMPDMLYNCFGRFCNPL